MTQNLAVKYSTKIDERFTQAAFTSAIVNKDYEFTGAETVKVYTINTVATEAYKRTGLNRFGTPAELTDAVQEMKVTQDRSFTYTIDKGNNLQQMNVKGAGASLRRELDEVIIPEMDKYILGKIIAGAGTTSSAVPITEQNAYFEFLDAQEALTDNSVPLIGRVCVATAQYFTAIKKDANFVKNADLGQKIALTGQVGAIDGVPLIVVPKSYFTLNYDFVITHPVATTAPLQLSEYRLHMDPPGVSGILAEGRFIYDAFVLNNKKKAIYAHKHA